MRALAILFGPALALGVVAGALHGNPVAVGILFGLAAPFLLIWAMTQWPTKPAPRKADPAKIRQMEHELGIEARHDPLTCAFCRVAEKAAAHSRRADDAPTTVAAFHGAPTFGHKIEGP